MTRVSVLIPAYNEERHICATLESLQADKRVDEIVLVDDGSRDKTASLARERGASVIRLQENIGKGGAINRGFAQLRGEYVLLLDADLQESACLALALLEPVMTGQADLAIAVFPEGKGGGGLGTVKKTARWGIRLMTGKYLTAPLSGQRCMRRQVLGDLLPLAPRFGLEMGMTIDALKKGYRLLEVAIDLEHCPPGRDLPGFLHRGRQFFDVLHTLGDRAWNR